MTKILLLETSSEVCSVAVAIDGRVAALVETPETLQHAALLTIQIQDCLHQAGLPLAVMDAIALSKGPGSYTSLRVGASVAKGICYALDKPLIAVDTLRALALASINKDSGAMPDDWYVPMLDARRQEVWLALYDSQLQEIIPPQPLIFENNSFEKFLLEKTKSQALPRIVLSGNGSIKAGNAQIPEQTVISQVTKCSATFLAPLALEAFQKVDFQDIAYFEPYYMKPPNITTPRESTVLTKI